MLSCFDVARYFLALVDEDAGDSLSNLKIQKLVYYAQGFHLALFDEPLFPESIRAWRHGPVVPELYHALKQFGAGPVKIEGEFDVDKYTPDVHALLTEVYSVYGQFSALKLRDITHEEPPWSSTAQGATITHDLMRDYFKTQLAK
ncbi:MAG TPA: type II toxin-antitoxin system antitoxin SocA domain-containing protein [Candidatus Acidoferrales bacterium]